MSEIFEQMPAPGMAIASPGVAAHIGRSRRGALGKRLRGLLYGLVISGALLGYGWGRQGAPGAGAAAVVGVVFTIFFVLWVPARIANHVSAGRAAHRLLREHPWVPVRFTFAEVEHPDGYPIEGVRLLKADGGTLLDLDIPWSAELRRQVRASNVTRLWCAGDPTTGAVIALPGGLHAFVYTPDAEPSPALSATAAGHDARAGVPAGIDPGGLVLAPRRGVRLLRLIAYNGVGLGVLSIVGGLTGFAGDDRSPVWSYLAPPLIAATPPILFLFIPLTVPLLRIDGTGITRTSARGKISRLTWAQLVDVEFRGAELNAYFRPDATTDGWYLSPRTGRRSGTLVYRERFGLSATERRARREAISAALPFFAWTVAGAQVRIDLGDGSTAPRH
ncbi:hypothetical protein [Embleya scabrispora]|uniref:hypothetical protein n=1 Tax=Embleya scabrispora TaxID=159449 RepID=UPI00035F228F|nr:hypothetical protein [Embleya scabrispora]MYS82291.1 hypothetical protein [Streptomyces sp. SID5474]